MYRNLATTAAGDQADMRISELEKKVEVLLKNDNILRKEIVALKKKLTNAESEISRNNLSQRYTNDTSWI